MAANSRLANLLPTSRGNGLAGELMRGGVGSLILKVGNIGLGIGLAVLLARLLGTEGYGVYAYVFSLVSVLSIPAQFGLPKLVVRETAKAQAQGQWGLIRGVWRWSSIATFGFTAALAIAAVIVSLVLSDHLARVQLQTFYWGVALVPLIAFGALRGAALQGLRRVVLGKLPETIIRPALLILTILLFAYCGQLGLTPVWTMVFHAFAAAAAFGLGAWWLYRSRPTQLSAKPQPVYNSRLWLAAIVPLALTAGVQMINQYADILILGIFGSASDIGVYRVAIQGAVLVVFGLQTVDMMISPYFARLNAQSDRLRLQRLLNLSGQAIFLLALPPFIIFAIWGKAILGLVFGAGYNAAYPPLLILSSGQLVNAAFGSVGFLLNMTGHELDTFHGIGVAAVCNVSLNFFLIPSFGLIGAATATATTLLVWNMLLWRAAHRRLGVETFVIYNVIKQFKPT